MNLILDKMNKDKLVAEMLTAKAEKNNTIDLDAYTNGLVDMYDNIVNLCKMNWQKSIGKYAYRVKDSKIINSRIDEGRVSIHLNTGSDRHGRLLDPVYEYRFERDHEWIKI